MSNLKKTIHAVRALVKIMSALTDMDNAIHDEKFGFNLKKDLPGFQKKMEDLIYEPSKNLFDSDDHTLATLIKNYDEMSESLLIKDSYITAVNMFLAKLESAKGDLEKLQNTNTHWITKLIFEIENFIGKKYLKQFTTWTDPHGETYHSIVKEINNLTNKLIVI